MNKYKKAIEVIDTLLHLMCGEEREDGYKPTMEEMSNSMDLLKDLANKADAFEWIPVSERLPEDNQIVLTSKNNSISILKYHADTKHWYETNGNWWWSFNMVDAWMPLPEPYKENEDEC